MMPELSHTTSATSKVSAALPRISIEPQRAEPETTVEEFRNRFGEGLVADAGADRDVEKGGIKELAVGMELKTESGRASQDDSSGRDENVVDWDGPDDPQKPLNWSARKKWTNVLFVSALTLLTPFDSSMFAPAVPDMVVEFQNANIQLDSFVVSIYVLGYAVGPLFIAPLSELYGRIPLYHINTILFLLFNIGCALSTNLSMLIVFRFLTGCAGSCPLTVGSGTIADLFRQEERGKVMAIWTFPVLFGPTLGPIAGSYLGQAAGWRWDFWFIVIMTGVLFVPAVFFMRETYPKALLERKAAALRKSTGNPNLVAATTSTKTARQLLLSSIIRPTKMLLFSPIIFGLSLYVAIAYGYLYLVFSTMTLVFENTYGISSGNVVLYYLGIGVGSFSGLLIFGYISDTMMKSMARKNGGEMKPEYRLPPLLPGGLMMAIGLFWYGWSAERSAHWIVPVLGTVFLGMGMMTVFMPVGTYLVDAFTVYAASALAANTVLRSLGGALLPLCGQQMYDSLGLGWGNSLLAFIALALVPFGYVAIRYGEWIRKRWPIDL